MKRALYGSLRLRAAILALLSGCLPGAAPEKPARADARSSAQEYFSDVILVNQHGEKLRFYSDLLKGKVVVINSFFATCTTVCPPMNHKLTQIQEALGDKLGKDVLILSLTVDPLNDTPPRLKEYAERYHAKPGWHFLTGKKENVDWALYKLGQYVEAKDDHSILFIMGNEPKEVWKKVLSTARTEELIRILQEVLNAR